MKLFTTPKSNYENYYEEGAFVLSWRYNLMMAVAYLALILAGALINSTVFFVGVIVWLIPVVSLYIMKKTLKYEAVAFIHVLLGTITSGLVLNLDLLQVHFVEVIFMLITVLYAFITLRRKIGTISLVIQFLWIVAYIFSDKPLSEELEISEKIAMMLILTTSLIVFGYLVVEFLKLRRAAEGKYVSVNRDLNEVNHVVSAQYQEKTVMLKEIHHRVKNNLQVISSLLRLQSYEIEEEASKVHFQDAIYRVSAMALIHEKMYQNENLSQINLKNYIESLAEDLVRTHAQGVDIELNIISDIKELGNDTLVPVALILNELMTNTMKHAFAGKSKGVIDIVIEKETERPNYFSFIYKDGGEWKVTPKGSSFGLELIATLTEQLDGKVERTYENGTKYQFILKDLK